MHILTGRDAADTTFLTTVGGLVHLPGVTVTAVVDMLSRDNVRDRIQSTLAAVQRERGLGDAQIGDGSPGMKSAPESGPAPRALCPVLIRA